MSTVSQLWHHTAVRFRKAKTWVGHGTSCQYKYHIFDEKAWWRSFNRPDVRKLGAHKMRWGCKTVFVNWLKQTAPAISGEEWCFLQWRPWSTRREKLTCSDYVIFIFRDLYRPCNKVRKQRKYDWYSPHVFCYGVQRSVAEIRLMMVFDKTWKIAQRCFCI